MSAVAPCKTVWYQVRRKAPDGPVVSTVDLCLVHIANRRTADFADCRYNIAPEDGGFRVYRDQALSSPYDSYESAVDLARHSSKTLEGRFYVETIWGEFTDA